MNILKKNNPKISIIVNFFNMPREARRTLYSLTADYQSGLKASDYQVIAIDNGSTEPLSNEIVAEFGPNFQYHFFETASQSPAAAINYGAQISRAPNIACIVDGARIASPGLILNTLRAIRAFSNPFICALAWHLGPKVQKFSMLEGYNQSTEDDLLDSIDWRENGYGLFEISTIAPSSSVGFIGGFPSECSWFAMGKSEFLNCGGLDERFQAPGGGLVNQDFLARIVESSGYEMVALIGEGVFHQFHGGAITGTRGDAPVRKLIRREYERIHGRPFRKFEQPPTNYVGEMSPEAARFLFKGATKGGLS